MTYPLPPTAADLVFEAPSSTGATGRDLVFGASSGPPPVYPAAMNGRFVLRGAVGINYDVSVWRGVSASVHAPHQEARAQGLHTGSDWQQAAQRQHLPAVVFGTAAPAAHHAAAPWAPTVHTQRRSSLPWATARDTHASAASGWDVPGRTDTTRAAPWQIAAPRGHSAAAAFFLARPLPLSKAAPWQMAALQQRATTARSNQAAKPLPLRCVAPWHMGAVLSSYGGARYLPAPAPTPSGPVVVELDMRFCTLYAAAPNPASGLLLIMGRNPCGAFTPDAPLYILPARFFMSVHSVAAYLLPGNTPVPIFDLSLHADVDSTVWTFSASTESAQFDALVPASGAPRQLRVAVDGMEWVFLVESLRQTTQFGKRRAQIGGRSATALVGDPYALATARLSSTPATAQQLATAALQYSGVGLDWGLTDWLVPAGAWSHSGTPLAAVQAIAQAAGGYLGSHRSAPTLLVRHPYPTLPGGIPGGPWNWEGAAGAFPADVELAPDVILSRSVDRADGADIDGVYVGGTVAGAVEALVRRSGTMGTKLAPMQTDALITATQAAQQRGLAVLGAGGAKHKVQIQMPVLVGGANPGLLDIGQLVQVNDPAPWRGRVRAVQMQYGAPSLRQTVTLERHLA